MNKKINVIDLFAGPGGLGEGFSSFKHNGKTPFDIKMSVEMDAAAHKTLTLRSFYRKFREKEIPEEYYNYLRNPELGTNYLQEHNPSEWSEALKETLEGPKELGTDDDKLIFERLNDIKKDNTNPFLVIGGPPCQAYSVMGRIKNNSIKGYDAKSDHRHFLYREYLKVLDVIEPEVFVMENVKGILTAKVDEERVFPLILDDLKCPRKALGKKKGKKYHIFSLSHEPVNFDKEGNPIYLNDQEFVIKSEKYGIPQKRHRVILLGIRTDISGNPIPDVLKETEAITVKKAIEDLPRLRSSVSRRPDDGDLWLSTVKKQGFELTSILKSHGINDVASSVESVANKLSLPQKKTGNKHFISYKSTKLSVVPEDLSSFYYDKKLVGVLNHFARSHMSSDLQRYLFCACFANVNWRRTIPSPSKKDFPEELAPNHKSWETGKFADRFRVQFKHKPSSTITSHINRDGHYFIHYDPTQCRSLSVREAARLQTFPDNYFFEGNQTQQFVQVGNAVPPYLARKIALIVFNIIDENL